MPLEYVQVRQKKVQAYVVRAFSRSKIKDVCWRIDIKTHIAEANGSRNTTASVVCVHKMHRKFKKSKNKEQIHAKHQFCPRVQLHGNALGATVKPHLKAQSDCQKARFESKIRERMRFA